MDAGEDIGQPCLRGQAIHLGRFDQGHGAGQRFGACIPSSNDSCRIEVICGGSIRCKTAALRSCEYPTSSSYLAPQQLERILQGRTTSLTLGALTMSWLRGTCFRRSERTGASLIGFPLISTALISSVPASISTRRDWLWLTARLQSRRSRYHDISPAM